MLLFFAIRILQVLFGGKAQPQNHVNFIIQFFVHLYVIVVTSSPAYCLNIVRDATCLNSHMYYFRIDGVEEKSLAFVIAELSRVDDGACNEYVFFWRCGFEVEVLYHCVCFNFRAFVVC